jgi:hypothetical protein
LVQDRNALQKHVWRARIVLMSAEGVGTNAIMRETGKAGLDPATCAVLPQRAKPTSAPPAAEEFRRKAFRVSAHLQAFNALNHVDGRDKPGHDGLRVAARTRIF